MLKLNPGLQRVKRGRSIQVRCQRAIVFKDLAMSTTDTLLREQQQRQQLQHQPLALLPVVRRVHNSFAVNKDDQTTFLEDAASHGKKTNVARLILKMEDMVRPTPSLTENVQRHLYLCRSPWCRRDSHVHLCGIVQARHDSVRPEPVGRASPCHTGAWQVTAHHTVHDNEYST